jgi:hypothetical protein
MQLLCCKKEGRQARNITNLEAKMKNLFSVDMKKSGVTLVHRGARLKCFPNTLQG